MDIQDLIEKHGNQSGLAKHFNVTRQYVSKWVAAGKIPEKYLLRELHREVIAELEDGEPSRSTQRLIRKIKAGLRPKPDAEGL